MRFGGAEQIGTPITLQAVPDREPFPCAMTLSLKKIGHVLLLKGAAV